MIPVTGSLVVARLAGEDETKQRPRNNEDRKELAAKAGKGERGA